MEERLSAEATITGRIVSFDRKTSRIGRLYGVAEIEAGREAPYRAVCFDEAAMDALERAGGQTATVRCRLDCRRRPSGFPEISLAVVGVLSKTEPRLEVQYEDDDDPFK